MRKIIRFIDHHLEETLCVIGFAFFILMSNIQVFTRLIPWIPIFPWTEELSRYSFVWVMFLGVSWAVRDNSHLKVDILVMYMPKTLQKICGAFSNLLLIGFSLFVGKYGWMVILKQMQIGQKLTATGLPMWIIYLCFPTSCTLVAFRAAQRLAIDWRETEKVLSPEELAVAEAEALSRAQGLEEDGDSK